MQNSTFKILNRTLAGFIAMFIYCIIIQNLREYIFTSFFYKNKNFWRKQKWKTKWFMAYTIGQLLVK